LNKNYTINLTSTIFILTTWGYLLVNIVIAWVPSLSSLFLLVRDSWVFIFLIYLFVHKKFISLYTLMSLLIVGSISLVERFDIPAIMTIFYGFRDLALYFLVFEFLLVSKKFSISEKNILLFVRVIMIISFLQIILTIFGLGNIIDAFFNTNAYFQNKGVASNLSSGFFGDRLSVPLYSSALVCTLISIFYLFERKLKFNFFEKFIALIVSIFTLSKVLVVVLFFRVIGKWWKSFFLIGLLSFPLIYIILDDYRKTLEIGIMSYHLASTFHHIHAFIFALEIGFLDFIPSILGSHSVAGSNFLGGGDYTIESSLLARTLDLKIYSLIFLCYVVFQYNKLSLDIKKKFIFMFLVLMALTATSNHPVIYLPFIFYLNILENRCQGLLK
jgi:hypothetical protein